MRTRQKFLLKFFVEQRELRELRELNEVKLLIVKLKVELTFLYKYLSI
jgi:hypothetical protein